MVSFNEYMGLEGPIMQMNKLIREKPRADKSAMGAMNDSVGKFCTDK